MRSPISTCLESRKQLLQNYQSHQKSYRSITDFKQLDFDFLGQEQTVKGTSRPNPKKGSLKDSKRRISSRVNSYPQVYFELVNLLSSYIAAVKVIGQVKVE